MQVALLQPFPPHDIVSPLLSLHCQHFLPVTPICHQNYHFKLVSTLEPPRRAWVGLNVPRKKDPGLGIGAQTSSRVFSSSRTSFKPGRHLSPCVSLLNLMMFQFSTKLISKKIYDLLLRSAHFKPAPTPFAQSADEIDVMITVVTFK